MVKRHIEPKDLDALNLILDRDPNLAGIVITKLDALESILSIPAAVPGHESAGQTLTAELEPKILAWFQTHPGKQSMTQCRADLGIAVGSKPFKVAVQNLIGAKSIKFNEKRGKGAEYWIP